MFSKELATKLIKIIDEREITVETLAKTVGLTREYITGIKNGHNTPSLDSFEKICSGLGLEPNDLLISKNSLQGDKAKPKKVTTIYREIKGNKINFIPVCPTCNSLLHNDWESYCNRCGQRLSWERYAESKIVCHKPKIKHE